MSVLVAYATRHGATREIAEAVAASLRADGLEADALPVKGVRSLDEYTAVVLGAPLYMFHLHADARRFRAIGGRWNRCPWPSLPVGRMARPARKYGERYAPA